MPDVEAHSELTKDRNGRSPDKVALLERFRVQMLATARRYSTNSHDADDAYQRAAEILLTHSPTGSDDDLCRWLRTTVKHEALAIRRQVERVAPAGEPQGLPEPRSAHHETAHDEVERSEQLSLGAQALGRLKPQEIRCLLLKAEGYSYEEIGEQTGFSYTKVNRCLTEGRRAFLARVASIESGAECDLVAPTCRPSPTGRAPPPAWRPCAPISRAAWPAGRACAISGPCPPGWRPSRPWG